MDEAIGQSAGLALQAAWFGGTAVVMDRPTVEQGKSSLVRVTVRSTNRLGLTHEVTSLLMNNPRRTFTLRAILDTIREGATAPEVTSILHKLVNVKGAVVLGQGHNGIRTVNTYRWRLLSDAR